MEGICKSFPGVKALDDAQLTVRPGTVHALMGENGAGKSTLMKCLFGIYSKDAGTIWFDGKEVNFKSSRDALDNGVAMVHQELNQALKRSVMDNIWLGRYPRIKLGGAKMPFVSDKAEYDMTMEVFKDLNLRNSASTSTRVPSCPPCPFRAVRWWKLQKLFPSTPRLLCWTSRPLP